MPGTQVPGILPFQGSFFSARIFSSPGSFDTDRTIGISEKNKAEAAAPPYAPDRSVSAASEKIHYTCRVIKKNKNKAFPQLPAEMPSHSSSYHCCLRPVRSGNAAVFHITPHRHLRVRCKEMPQFLSSRSVRPVLRPSLLQFHLRVLPGTSSP